MLLLGGAPAWGIWCHTSPGLPKLAFHNALPFSCSQETALTSSVGIPFMCVSLRAKPDRMFGAPRLKKKRPKTVTIYHEKQRGFGPDFPLTNTAVVKALRSRLFPLEVNKLSPSQALPSLGIKEGKITSVLVTSVSFPLRWRIGRAGACLGEICVLSVFSGPVPNHAVFCARYTLSSGGAC